MGATLISELFPWFSPALQGDIEKEYYDWLCHDESDEAKKVWKNFWDSLPEHVKKNPNEVEYMWDDYLLQTFEPWIDVF